MSYRRLWKCAGCRKPFSVLVDTIFERSEVPLSKWLMALFMMASSKNGVAAFEVQRTLGVTQKTAWFMMHRLREAMKRGGLVDTMPGTISADEKWIGGDPKNRHASAKNAPVPYKPGSNRKTDKTSVLSLINTTTGEVRSRVVPDVTGATLRKVISEQGDSRSVFRRDSTGLVCTSSSSATSSRTSGSTTRDSAATPST